MKNRTLFLCFVLVLVICVAMAGCGSASGENAGGNGAGKADSQAWNDSGKPQNQAWSDPENPDDQDWSDPENPDDQDWSDPENSGAEATDPGESDHAGTYRHEIGGVVFYTEHDVEQWIDRSNPNQLNFDLNQMVKDIFGDAAISGNNIAKIPYYWGTITLDIKNRDMTGNKSSRYAGNGYYPCIQVSNSVICDMGDGSSDDFKPYYYLNGSDYTTEYEIIEIALYTCERWAGDGEVQYIYLFDNFRSSERFYFPEYHYR